MALKKKFLFIAGTFFMVGFLSCDKSPSGSEQEEPQIPMSVDISSPAGSTTYWNDQAVACRTDQPDYTEQTTWLVDGVSVSCVDGELTENLSAGEHTITVRITNDGETIKNEVTIKVKEGFSVTLNKPANNAEFFVGDELSCAATVIPKQYEDKLEITVNGQSCTNGTVWLTEAGATSAVASVTVDNRTERDEITTQVKQAIAGRVYPQTSAGVIDNASGFRVTLRAGGEELDTQTDAEGNFAIKSDRISELGGEQVSLEVAASADFYGSRAIIPADELLELVEQGRLGFPLAPRRWYIRDGKLAGNSAKLQLKAAFTRVLKGDPNDPDDFGDPFSSFYKLTKIFGKYKYVSVSSEYIPIPVAFNDVKNDVSITKSDSTDFWQQTDTVTEPYVGRGNLFTAATIDQVPTVFDGIHVYSGKAGDRSGASGASEGNGYIVGGHIDLAIDKFGGYIQTHEQVHNLDFGHASQWNGLMTYEVFHGPNGERVEVPGRFREKLTTADVSHIQVYIDAFDLQFREDISFGVLEWMQALDIDGLPATTSSQAKVAGKYAGS